MHSSLLITFLLLLSPFAIAEKDNCVPAKDTAFCQGFDIVLPEEKLSMIDFMFGMLISGVQQYCPEASNLLTSPLLRGAICLININGTEAAQKCNPGKPVQLCKSVCKNGLERGSVSRIRTRFLEWEE